MSQQRANAERFGIGLFPKTRRQTPLQMKTGSLIRVESRIGVPCRQDHFHYQGGLEFARRAVLLWFAGLGVFSCGMFRQSHNYFCFYRPRCFPVSLETSIQISSRWPQKKSKPEGRQSPDGLKHYLGIKRLHKQETACRPSTHVSRLVDSVRVGSSSQVDGQYFQVAFDSRI